MTTALAPAGRACDTDAAVPVEGAADPTEKERRDRFPRAIDIDGRDQRRQREPLLRSCFWQLCVTSAGGVEDQFAGGAAAEQVLVGLPHGGERVAAAADRLQHAVG